jgi:hypothetical protein
MENDAVGCYDRMVNNILLYELQRLGLPLPAVRALHSVWANAVHHIGTKYGVSDISYSNSTERPLYGPGQGSTLGSFLWLILFTLMVRSIDPTLHHTTLHSADCQVTSSDTGDAFVDDTKVGCTSTYTYDENLSLQENSLRAESDAIAKLGLLSQQWERLLFATGGALCLEKSFWYLLSWRWTKSGTDYPSTTALAPGKLLLTAGRNTTPTEVPRIESTSSFCTLGVRISPAGKSDLALSVLRSQSTDFATRISSS